MRGEMPIHAGASLHVLVNCCTGGRVPPGTSTGCIRQASPTHYLPAPKYDGYATTGQASSPHPRTHYYLPAPKYEGYATTGQASSPHPRTHYYLPASKYEGRGTPPLDRQVFPTNYLPAPKYEGYATSVMQIASPASAAASNKCPAGGVAGRHASKQVGGRCPAGRRVGRAGWGRVDRQGGTQPAASVLQAGRG